MASYERIGGAIGGDIYLRAHEKATPQTPLVRENYDKKGRPIKRKYGIYSSVTYGINNLGERVPVVIMRVTP